MLDTKLAMSAQESAEPRIMTDASNNKRNSPKEALNPISAFSDRASIDHKAPIPR